MKGTRKKIMRLSAWISLVTAAVVALSVAMGMCGGNAAAVAVALLFEAIALICFWLSGGFR